MKFKIKTLNFGYIFLGIGIIITRNLIGVTILDLFIGVEDETYKS